MDCIPVPSGFVKLATGKFILDALSPPGNDTWGDLKHWVSRTKHLIPDPALADLKKMQATHYHSLSEKEYMRLRQLVYASPMTHESASRQTNPTPMASTSRPQSSSQLIPGSPTPQPNQVRDNMQQTIPNNGPSQQLGASSQ